MIRLEVPFPAVEAIVSLPNAVFGDSRALRGTLGIKRMMDGSRRTHIKGRAGRKRLRYDIELSREKALELYMVIEELPYAKMKLTATDGEQYVGYLEVNPVEFEGVARAKNSPGDEKYRVTILFDGTLV